MATTYKMTYFNVRGLGEPIRYLLVYGGIDFEDKRIGFEQWPAMKSTTPYGKLPLMEIDGEQFHQSAAIARYIAKQLKLTGDDDIESMLCDIVVDTFSDFRSQMTSWFREKDEAIKEKKRGPLINETVPFYMERFEKELEKNNGYFVRGKLTWADFYVAAVVEVMEDMCKISCLDKYPNIKAHKEKIENIPQIKAYIEKRPKTPF
ncbi:glutathione S-transferase-like [Ischnura elegans]|uniref:glutathione S-transferase-like n=1 Tax=Ischnura elegans TaxID=197161 RepID=UPI001ED8B3D7|nr:glutathione S-transferase-like [Ischnura elegans]